MARELLLAELIKLATDITESACSDEERIAKIETYVQVCDALVESGSELFPAELSTADKSVDKSVEKAVVNKAVANKAVEQDLKHLQALHASVLEQARAMQGEASEKLRKLKFHGRGVLVYTDYLPKRISSMKPRKG